MFLSTGGGQHNMHMTTILLALRGNSIALFNELIGGKCYILRCFRKSLDAAVWNDEMIQECFTASSQQRSRNWCRCNRSCSFTNSRRKTEWWRTLGKEHFGWGHLFLSALQEQISEEDQIHPLNQKNVLIWFWDSQSAFSLLPGLFESHSCEDNSSDKFSSSRMQNWDTSEKAEKQIVRFNRMQ